MNIAMDLDNFEVNNIFFDKPLNNTVIKNSLFFRIIYSNTIFSTTGAHLHFKISSSDNTRDNYNILSNLEKNKVVVSTLAEIEKQILARFCAKGKTPVFKIWHKLHFGHIKLLTDRYVVKISGIWETDTEYGITHRFITPSNV